MGQLTTHVLDTARGRPAAGLALSLWRIAPSGERVLLTTTRTNADGRTSVPLLAGDAFTAGTYELVFEVGDYFAGHPDVSQPPFLDQVPVRFTVADPAAHYHVPLLVSPWSYVTYRGS
ncbi:MAG: hydroxyisourate hydrolase [Thermorudis peleae]|nr:hydroxyisourate hydrolase [Thermorudis peleae]